MLNKNRSNRVGTMDYETGNVSPDFNQADIIEK